MIERPEHMINDATAISQSRHEPEAFAVLYDRHAAAIYRYVARRLGAAAADDIVAECFLAAFGRRDSYDLGQGDARPWLYGIAVRQIASNRRAEARYRRLLASAPLELVTEDFSDRAAERVSALALRPQLAAVLDGMRWRDRELLLLVAWAGLSYEESAAALGITVSAVKSRLNRIRVRTRASLADSKPVAEER